MKGARPGDRTRPPAVIVLEFFSILFDSLSGSALREFPSPPGPLAWVGRYATLGGKRTPPDRRPCFWDALGPLALTLDGTQHIDSPPVVFIICIICHMMCVPLYSGPLSGSGIRSRVSTLFFFFFHWLRCCRHTVIPVRQARQRVVLQ